VSEFDTSQRTAVAEQPSAVEGARGAPVLVTGAAGLVGAHTCRELTRRGFRVRALVRDPAKAASRLSHLPVEIRAGDLRDGDVVRAAVSGVGTIVHLAAIAIEKQGQRYEDINTEATRTLLEAAKDSDVRRFIHMSQNGSSSSSPYRFLRSKGVAEDLVAQSDRQWTILKPSVIFGPEDEFVNVLARLVRLTPVIFPLPGGGRARFQPIAVDDVARAIAVAIDGPTTIGGRYPLGGPEPLTLAQMTERILEAMETSRMLVPVPIPMLRPVVAVMERVLPNPPVTTGLLDLLSLDNTVPDNAITKIFKINPMRFDSSNLQHLKRITIKSAFASLFGN
jgi:uncharacterized protein YbjT (DUF2867 family)